MHAIVFSIFIEFTMEASTRDKVILLCKNKCSHRQNVSWEIYRNKVADNYVSQHGIIDILSVEIHPIGLLSSCSNITISTGKFNS